jgi:hypothetical protein
LDPPRQIRTHADELRGDIALKCGSPARARDILFAATETADPEAAVGLLPAGRRCWGSASGRQAEHVAGRDRASRHPRDRPARLRGRQGAL